MEKDRSEFIDIEKIEIENPPAYQSQEDLKDLKNVAEEIKSPRISKDFSLISHSDISHPFLIYCSELQLPVNISLFGCKARIVSEICDTLKNKFKRKRPKERIKKIVNKELSEVIPDMGDSYSYPSGHALISAYIASDLSSQFPQHAENFLKIAYDIADSRISLGVHYPTDCQSGLSAGFELYDNFYKNIENLSNSNHDKNIKKSVNKFQQVINNAKDGEKYIFDLAYFIVRSNQIERYDVHFHEALDAVKCFVAGYPINYCTENTHILSHLGALSEAGYRGIKKPIDVCRIHFGLGNAIEKGVPGMYRYFKHGSRSGIMYPDPSRVPFCMDWWTLKDWDTPWEAHAAYERIHPFSDGNGRSGRILMASMLDFDFDKVNSLIDKDYISHIVDFANNSDISLEIENI